MHPGPNNKILNARLIQKEIMEMVVASPARLTPQYLEKTISEKFGLPEDYNL